MVDWPPELVCGQHSTRCTKNNWTASVNQLINYLR